MREPRFVERLWRSDTAGAVLGRAALAPAQALYAGIVAIRGAMYDTGLLRSHDLALPAISVGNLSVGGTGKTPVAAWIAAELLSRGARPAIVLRGYGDDEPLVHATLNPSVPVIVSPDRFTPPMSTQSAETPGSLAVTSAPAPAAASAAFPVPAATSSTRRPGPIPAARTSSGPSGATTSVAMAG